jgi:mRNA interferase MazF
MGEFVVGDVVVVNFPFSDLTSYKVRPAVVVANVEFDNLILCQITSKPYASRQSISLTKTDFKTGSLPIKSYIRPDKLFTADITIIRGRVGTLTSTTSKDLLAQIRSLF